MISEHDLNKARENFILASNDFGFTFHSPFPLTDILSAFGYIESYGSANGVIVCLGDFSEEYTSTTYRDVIDWCKEMDCFFSLLNIKPLLGEYKRSYFSEMLRDWGKYPNRQPR